MLTLPYQLGPFRLERLLGQGGMGIVYEAYDQRLERRVAVKRMLTGSGDRRRRERLRREARTTAQLGHPVIVQVFDLIEEDQGDWIVMELVEGTALARRLANGPLDVDLALRYGQQIAEGLAAAHQIGIVHRDLKTENVMILPDHRVKILDFGLAKRLDFLAETTDDGKLSEPGVVMGTGRAMAPEQIRGLEVGPRADLFSFGVLLYEVLTGISPFRAKTFDESLQRVLTHQPKPARVLEGEVPQALSDLVDRLMSKAPELRPASAREVAIEISHLAETRRLQERRRLVDDIPDPEDAATVTATALMAHSTHVLDVGSGIDSGHSRPRLRIGDLIPPARLLASALVVVVPVALVMTLDMPKQGSSSRDAAVARPLTSDPLRLYEETMNALRRVEQPANVDRAIETFKRLIERDHDSAAAHAGLARAYWEKARIAAAGADPVFLELALAAAREGVRFDAYLADARVSLGLAQLSRGRHDEARDELEGALELDPANADAHYGLAKLAESLGNPEEAERHHREAIERGSAPLYHNALGSLLYDSGRYAEAEEAFLASLAMAPGNIHALRNLSALYYAHGRYDEAATKLQSALKIRPDASLYSNLGTIFFSRGLYSKAAAAFEDALAMDGATNKFVYWTNLADAYRQIPGMEESARSSYRRAIQLLDEAIEAAPDDVRLLSRRALARSRAGEKTAALDDVDRIRELGAAGDLYSIFRLAIAEEVCGERERALTSLEEALRSGLALMEARIEPDLVELRADPRFHLLLVELDEG